jgi:hypothetical protein
MVKAPIRRRHGRCAPTLLDQQAEWSKREHLDHRHCHGQCVRPGPNGYQLAARRLNRKQP